MTIKRAAQLLLIAFICPLSDSATQDVPKPNGPVLVKAQPADYSKEPYVFELIQTKVRFEMDGKGQRELTIRARIQSESAVRELGLLAYAFASSFESLDVVYVRVRKPDGSVVETPQSDIQELDSAVSREAPMYSDTREKHIAVKSLGVGDVLEAQLHWTMHDPIAPEHFWFVDSFFRGGICLKETLQLDLPKAAGARVASEEVKPSIDERGDRQIYTFENANLKKAQDAKIPDWEKNFYGIDPPEVRVSSFHTWDEVGRWYAQLQESKSAVTSEIKAKAEELTKGKTSEEDKIRALYDFVSLHFRYIGVDLGAGRYTPHAAADILANSYGDCKDKHTLLAALLKAVGITAHPALISSRFRIDPTFPTTDLFDHVITAIPKGDSYLFLDTTPEVAPYGLLLAGLRDRQVLVIPNEGQAKLVKTPPEPLLRSYETVTIDSSIDTEGTLDAKMRIEERGDGEIALRSAYRATPQNRWDELTQVLVNQMGFAGKASDVTVGRPEDTTQAFAISFKYHRTDFPDWKEHRIVLPAPFLILADLTDEQRASKKALPIGSIRDVTFESTVKLPKGFTLAVPENVSRKTEFAEFSAEYTFGKDGVLHGKVHWKTLEREAPGDKRNQYVELTKTVDNTMRQYIPVIGQFAGNIAVLLENLAKNPEAAVPELEKQLKDNPDNPAFPMMLANAYMKAGRAKDAVALLEKREADHQADALFQVALGEAYFAIPDVDKAMEHFNKGLDQDPAAMMLNNVAYLLGDAKVKLDDAEAFSRKSVEKISRGTEAISADGADKADFQSMAELAASWDTLGWIKFQKGEFEEAEKYIAASWELVQDPVVGEHLVETYEKRSKLQRAAKVCAMAQRAFGHEGAEAKLREEMKRLQKYLPPNAPDPSVALSDMRTVHLPFHPKLQEKAATGNVVIVFDREGKADVAFKNNARELEKGKEILAAFKYPQSFPDGTAVKIVRKGTLNCSIYFKDCTLILMKPTEAVVPGNW
jgi:tetratricopeptide (TPR) repeat protein